MIKWNKLRYAISIVIDWGSGVKGEGAEVEYEGDDLQHDNVKPPQYKVEKIVYYSRKWIELIEPYSTPKYNSLSNYQTV